MKSPLLKSLVSTNSSWGPLLPRLALAAVFIAHGSQKLFGAFGGYGLKGTAGFFANTLGMTPGLFWATFAGCSEFVGGLLLLFGLFTRVGALLIAGVMTVAICKVHWGKFFLPMGMEFAMTILAVALSLLIMGGGRFSIDSGLQKSRGSSD